MGTKGIYCAFTSSRLTFYLLAVRISKQISFKSQLCTRVDISKSIYTVWVSLSKLMSLNCVITRYAVCEFSHAVVNDRSKWNCLLVFQKLVTTNIQYLKPHEGHILSINAENGMLWSNPKILQPCNISKAFRIQNVITVALQITNVRALRAHFEKFNNFAAVLT